MLSRAKRILQAHLYAREVAIYAPANKHTRLIDNYIGSCCRPHEKPTILGVTSRVLCLIQRHETLHWPLGDRWKLLLLGIQQFLMDD